MGFEKRKEKMVCKWLVAECEWQFCGCRLALYFSD